MDSTNVEDGLRTSASEGSQSDNFITLKEIDSAGVRSESNGPCTLEQEPSSTTKTVWIQLGNGWVLSADHRQWITGRPDETEYRRILKAYYHTSLRDALLSLLVRGSREMTAESLPELMEVFEKQRGMVVKAAEEAADRIVTSVNEAAVDRQKGPTEEESLVPTKEGLEPRTLSDVKRLVRKD